MMESARGVLSSINVAIFQLQKKERKKAKPLIVADCVPCDIDYITLTEYDITTSLMKVLSLLAYSSLTVFPETDIKRTNPQVCFPLMHLPPPSAQGKDVELRRHSLLSCSTFFLACSRFSLDCLIKGVSQFTAPWELNMSSDVPSIFILHASDILPYCLCSELVMSC